IADNDCSDNHAGIHFSLSSGSGVIINNSCDNNDISIDVSQSDLSRVDNNTCNQYEQGIHIYDSDQASIINNSCSGSTTDAGIKIEQSSSALVEDNTCHDNIIGISVASSSAPALKNNTCASNNDDGIVIDSSGPATVANNTIMQHNRYGIHLLNSPSSIVGNNTFIEDGLHVEDTSLANYLSYDIENNTVNGLELAYIKSESGTTYANPVFGQVILVDCDSVVLSNQVCSFTTTGIVLRYSDNCQVISCTCSNNKIDGIRVTDSGSVSILSCTCDVNINTYSPTNGFGISFENSGSAVLKNNTCRQNARRGISLYQSPMSDVINNTIEENDYGIYIDSSILTTIANNTCIENGHIGIFSNSGYTDIINNTCNNTHFSNIGTAIECSGDDSKIINNSCGCDSAIQYLQREGIRASGDSLIIENNTCTDTYIGLMLWNLLNSQVKNNTLLYNYEGIELYQTDGTTIVENTIETPIDLYSCGLKAYDSDDNDIENNRFYKAGIYLEDRTSYLTNTISGNTINNKLLGFFRDENSLILDEPAVYGQLILFNCNYAVIEKQDCSETNFGLTLYESNFCSAVNCSFEENNIGIYLYTANNCSLVRNRMAYSQVGLNLKYSGNTSSYLNTFLLNDYNVWDENPTAPNIFYDMLTLKGNYWTNNDSGGLDPHSYPVVPVINPSNTSYTYMEDSTGNYIWWKIISDDNPRDYEVYSGDTFIKGDSWKEGTVVNVSIDGLTPGSYEYTIYVFDLDDFNSNSTISVTVNKMPVAPSIDSPGDVTVTAGETAKISWIGTDDNPLTYSIWLNNALEVASMSWSSGVAIDYLFMQLTVGTYNVTITITDQDGLQATDTVMVTVISGETSTTQTTTPGETTKPEETTSSSSGGFESPGYGIIMMLAVMLAMSLFNRRKK
ncbi:MAG: NosD domain-containing protein, partial [Candidatus Odinarchaeota archaeon]